MDNLFKDFQQAHLVASGPLLASTLVPLAHPEDPSRLKRFYQSSRLASISSDIRSGLLAHTNTNVRFLKGEGNAWVDVYVAYWRCIGEIIAIEEGSRDGWASVYEAWKELTNTLIKGYSGSWFDAWTVPCLYVTSRYLRVFAIKADEYGQGTRLVAFNTGIQDDIASELGKNEKLEDAARIINRIFTLCISDRYVANSDSALHNSTTSHVLRLAIQSATRRLQKVGTLSYHQSPFQNIFQGEHTL